MIFLRKMAVLKLQPPGKKYPILQMQFLSDKKKLLPLSFRIARLLQLANCAILILISDDSKDFSAEISPAKNVFDAQKKVLEILQNSALKEKI